MTKNTVVATFNGLIPQMREEGHTLQAIGETCGVTRERIRQILEKHYPGTKSLLVSEGEARALLGFRLEKIRLKGLVSPLRLGKHWLYDKSELEKAMLIHYHPCLMCGGITTRQKYCEKCSIERRRNSCKFRNPEQKARHRKLVRRRVEEHPERAAEIQRKAARDYGIREKERHFRETVYAVFRHCALPIGTKFKAIRCSNRKLILISGIKIPIGCVRKTNDRPKTI